MAQTFNRLDDSTNRVSGTSSVPIYNVQRSASESMNRDRDRESK